MFGGLMCLSVAGCSFSEETPARQGLVDLKLNVALSDGMASTRGYEDPANTGEVMNSLRFIIVRPDGTVEHNRYLDADDFNPTTRYGYETFQVVDSEDKLVYLFVNEETTTISNLNSAGAATTYTSLQARLAAITPGTQFPTAEVTGWLVSLSSKDAELALPLPMNECHKVVVPSMNEATVVEKDLWVTRAATKFTYRIVNQTRLTTLSLSKLTIDRMAWQEYYLLNPNSATGNPYTNWEVTNYTVPSPQGTNNGYYQFERAYDITLPQNKMVVLPSIYLLEGKYENTGDTRNYGTTLKINGRDFNKMLPNNSNLPRNTHVVVTVTLKDVDSDVTWEVDLYPYTAITLDPIFGI